MSTEPYGTTPLPTTSSGSPVKLTIDPAVLLPHAQQPQSQPMANFEASFTESDGHLVSVNSHFLVYPVKNGLIRVLHRASATRSLLRVHEGQQVQDLQFFGDVLASVGTSEGRSWVFVSRIFERGPELASEVLLEIRSSVPTERVVWHPFNLNQFWMVQEKEAILVETTRITTRAEPHAVCDNLNEAVRIPAKDVCWSDSRHVLAVSGSTVSLYDLKGNDPVATMEDDSFPTKVFLLPHTQETSNYFVTCSQKNAQLTIWSPLPTASRQQVLCLPTSSSYVVDVAKGTGIECFIVVADRMTGSLLAFHLDANACANYVVPFQLKFPIYSWSLQSQPTTDISDEELQEQGALNFDVKVFAYQQKAVQALTVTSYMCLPPAQTWTDPTPGVQVERLWEHVHSAHVSVVGSDDPAVDENYDVVDEDEEEEAPPPAQPVVNNSLLANPFANWLGAIAANTITPAEQPPPPPVEPKAPPAAALPIPAVADLPMPPLPDALPAPPKVNPLPPPPKVDPVPSKPKKQPTPVPSTPKAAPELDMDAITRAVREAVKEGVRGSMAESLKTVLIPAIESVTGQILQQVSEKLSAKEAENERLASEVAALSKQVEALSTQVKGLRRAPAPTPPKQPSPVVVDTQGQAQMLKDEVLGLLAKKQYEVAFTKVFSAQSLDLLLECCLKADIDAVLGGDKPQLSQPILLCLMQQLGALMASKSDKHLQVVIQWLEEVSISIETKDESIRRHLPNVIKNVADSIQKKLSSADPAMKRPLQRLLKIVQGVQI